jgi:hypothetical protein
MVDRVTASQGADALAVAIAEIMEDTMDGAIRTPKDLRAYSARAKDLASAGDDIARLAAAMSVLARRGARDR